MTREELLDILFIVGFVIIGYGGLFLALWSLSL